MNDRLYIYEACSKDIPSCYTEDFVLVEQDFLDIDGLLKSAYFLFSPNNTLKEVTPAPIPEHQRRLVDAQGIAKHLISVFLREEGKDPKALEIKWVQMATESDFSKLKSWCSEHLEYAKILLNELKSVEIKEYFSGVLDMAKEESFNAFH